MVDETGKRNYYVGDQLKVEKKEKKRKEERVTEAKLSRRA